MYLDLTNVDIIELPKAQPDTRNIPQSALQEQARIFTDGLKTHERNDWQEIPNTVHWKSFFGHLTAHFLGELTDKDSGDTHLSHALSRLTIIVDNMINGR